MSMISLSRTFTLNVPSWWNDLPNSFRAAESLAIFKNRLKWFVCVCSHNQCQSCYQVLYHSDEVKKYFLLYEVINSKKNTILNFYTFQKWPKSTRGLCSGLWTEKGYSLNSSCFERKSAIYCNSIIRFMLLLTVHEERKKQMRCVRICISLSRGG